MNTLVLQGAHVATVDSAANEYTDGHVVVTDGLITAVGDGPKYRGMGPIQLTGKYNVAQCGKALKLPLVEEPKRLLLPEVGFRAAGWYWRKGKPTDLNALGAKNTEEAFREITRLVNGAYLGLADRLVYWNRARKLYGVMPA